MTTVIDKSDTKTQWARDQHWTKMVEHWQQIGPPLRPSPQDIEFFEDAVQEWIHRYGAPRVLLLGVTPEIYRLRWPEGTDFLAVDHAQAMIDAVWPGPKKAVQCTEWIALSLPKNSRDIVLCDGGLHLLAYPGEQQQLAHLLRDVLSDNGMCILRLFVPPAQRESSDAVISDLLEGKISSLNILKLRLGMSLLKSAAEGVELGRVWRLIHEAAPDLEDLAAKIGWSLEYMLAINAYRGSTARYYFVTVDQVSELFCNNSCGFETHRLRVPSYDLGERCPTIVLRRL
ncbi:MAG TPA: hypothetical protein VJ624_06525 [Thermodesulfobacteriota bacterium]|nr:hypothetical protein [Thermodesulfobacteriota bacterium]